jgi:hypothetical protein
MPRQNLWAAGGLTWAGRVVQVHQDKEGLWAARVLMPHATLTVSGHPTQKDAERSLLASLTVLCTLRGPAS